MGISHNAILFPGDKVVDTWLDAEATARAGVHLLSFRGPYRLNSVGVASLGLCSTKAGGEALNVERFTLGASRTFGSITSRHD
jgi:hypothetical protein